MTQPASASHEASRLFTVQLRQPNETTEKATCTESIYAQYCSMCIIFIHHILGQL